MTHWRGWNSGCFICFYKSVSVIITLSIWFVLLRSGPELCISNYRSPLVPFHIGSMFLSFRGSTYHGIIQVMIGFGSTMTYFLFQLQIILSIVRQRATTGITRLVNWLGSSTGGRFIINLDRVMICEDEVHSAILCVQDFIRCPHFTQRYFFSDSGIAMLAEFASISNRITHSAIFEPWSHVETTSRSQVVAGVCGCVKEALDRRRVVKDSQEQ